MSEHWTAEELKEYQRTGREPERYRKRNTPEQATADDRDLQSFLNAYLNPIPQEEIERAYAEAEKRGEVYALDITEYPDGKVSMRPAGRVTVPEAVQDNAPKKRKYRNEPVYVNGVRFDSKHEANVYMELMTRARAGEIRCVLRQVGFDLPGGIRYFADFVTIGNDYRIEVLDAKSEITRKNRVYINKKKQMAALWGIEIQEV